MNTVDTLMQVRTAIVDEVKEAVKTRTSVNRRQRKITKEFLTHVPITSGPDRGYSTPLWLDEDKQAEWEKLQHEEYYPADHKVTKLRRALKNIDDALFSLTRT